MEVIPATQFDHCTSARKVYETLDHLHLMKHLGLHERMLFVAICQRIDAGRVQQGLLEISVEDFGREFALHNFSIEAFLESAKLLSERLCWLYQEAEENPLKLFAALAPFSNFSIFQDHTFVFDLSPDFLALIHHTAAPAEG